MLIVSTPPPVAAVLCVIAAVVHTGMGALTLGGVLALGPFALHPFEIGEPGAVNPLVHHACRYERSVFPGERRG